MSTPYLNLVKLLPRHHSEVNNFRCQAGHNCNAVIVHMLVRTVGCCAGSGGSVHPVLPLDKHPSQQAGQCDLVSPCLRGGE